MPTFHSHFYANMAHVSICPTVLLAQKKLTSVCRQEVTACFTSASVTNHLPPRGASKHFQTDESHWARNRDCRKAVPTLPATESAPSCKLMSCAQALQSQCHYNRCHYPARCVFPRHKCFWLTQPHLAYAYTHFCRLNVPPAMRQWTLLGVNIYPDVIQNTAPVCTLQWQPLHTRTTHFTHKSNHTDCTEKGLA